MEYLPCSLYDVLHSEGLRLTRTDILTIATQVLTALQHLHAIGESFGSTLTSRKVMFGGIHHVKLRRFCSEWITRGLVPCSSSSSSSQYVMPGHEEGEDKQHRSQRQDLYAFGMLVLEMCAHEKPNPEIVNRIASTVSVDERLERIVRATLAVETSDAPDGTARLLHFCMKLLHECTAIDVNLHQDSIRSCVSFPSFLHADRYVQCHMASAIDRHVEVRLRQSEVALKRLAAVEDELVDEQKNFAVVVNQLEQLRLEKAGDEHEIGRLNDAILEQNTRLETAETERRRVAEGLQDGLRRIEDLERSNEAHERNLERAKADRRNIELERQQLAGEILKLKAEKQQYIDDGNRVEKELAVVAAKVGGERDAVIELEARYAQAVRRCEQEQHAKRAVERQLEAINRQLSQLEDERAKYTGELQLCPTGRRDVRASQSLVLELKQKEVDAVRAESKQLVTELARTRQRLEQSESECRHLRDEVCVDLQRDISELTRLTNELQQSLEKSNAERELAARQVAEIERQVEESRVMIAGLESQVEELQRKSADAGKPPSPLLLYAVG